MRNLFSFTSFLSSLNESNIDALSLEDLIRSRGGEEKDFSLPMNQFGNIQKVFGDTDYLTRLQIAQALKITGRELFLNNSKFKNPDTNKDLSSKDGIFMTFYIGDKDQNEVMDKVSEELLKAIKPVVDFMKENPDSIQNFFKKEASELPVVKQSKVNIGKIRG